MNSLAIIGDVHGCFEELKELVAELRRQGIGEILLAGDLCDRGPSTREVIEFCMRNNLRGVQGNHDSVIVEHWKTMLRNDGKIFTANPDKIRTLRELEQKHIDYLASLAPLIVRDDLKLVIVHGGLFPKLPFHRQVEHSRALMRLQLIKPYVYGETRWYGVDKKGRTEAENRADGWVRWQEAYDHEYSVVYGHSVFHEPGVRRNPGSGFTIGIDTGCVFGGKLTAIIMPEMRFVSVPAKKVYSGRAMNTWNEGGTP